jgi:hypothetical protein
MQSFGDFAFSSKSGAVFLAAGVDDKPSSTPVIPSTDFDKALWARWGDNNLMPEEIADDIRNCGVLAAALDAKARIGTGKGMQPFLLCDIDAEGKEQLEWVSDSEIHDWLDLNESFEFGYDSSFDKHAYGWNCGSYVLNLGRKKIARVKRHDVYEARLEKKDAHSRIIQNLYLSADWKAATGTYEPLKQVRIPLLEEGNELADLEYRIANNKNEVEYAFVNRTLRNGSHYYPSPTYRAGKAWIKVARSVPAFMNAMFRNQVTLKYVVIIHPKFWEDKFGQVRWNKYTPDQKKEKTDEYYNKLDTWLSGEDASYKSLFTGGFNDPANGGKYTPFIDIQTIDDKIKEGKYLPESGAANSEILFALMVNPALMGAGNPGGRAYGDTSGGSNVRETFLVQIMIMEAERRLNASVFNPVKKFNGWSERLEVAKTFSSGVGQNTPQSKIIKPRLVFRYPTGLLSTLDTGGSLKNVAA